MDDFAQEVATEAVRLAQGAGLPILVTLALLLVSALLLVAARRLKGLSWPKADAPGPAMSTSEWITDPAAGAVVKPGPPGGSDDQVQSG